ncbi:hypothetical protein [Paenibacillus piscarius]|uniref:hypothetical protein n=1 Tax=Paenibacillus piscarius TaxID=1089681 RepID=UPI001EE7C9FC|nr:hypothetical protein [Paenibacillus piscarius]
MFSINVEFSMYLKSVDIVMITGKYLGRLTGDLLVGANNIASEYVINNVVYMGYLNPQMNKDAISLNLKTKWG